MPTLVNAAFDPALLSRIEDAGLNASAPPQQRWVDGWLVRCSPGKAKRARCINAVAAGRLPLAARMKVCAEAFAQAQLPLIVRITPFTVPPELDELLQREGLLRFDDTRVMVLTDLPAAGAAAAAGSGVTIQSIGLEAFAQRIGVLRGSPLSQRQAHAERLLNSPVPFFAFELRIHGSVAACGQVAIEGQLAGLYDVFTAEPARGRGLARALCERLLLHARSCGARQAYLQVEADNHPARSLYARVGFADGYSYHYRTLDPATA